MEKENLKDIYLAGGCFWGTEHYLKQIDGVVDTEVGFANGRTKNPTYKEVCTDKTGFAETVHVTYDPAKVSLKFLLEIYFKAIDPTSINRQGHDTGTQYRTGVYYTDKDDEKIINEVFAEEQKHINGKSRRLLPSAAKLVRVCAQGKGHKEVILNKMYRDEEEYITDHVASDGNNGFCSLHREEGKYCTKERCCPDRHVQDQEWQGNCLYRHQTWQHPHHV